MTEYLRLRRALGFTLADPGRVLPQFVAWMEVRGGETVTVEAALEWTRLTVNASTTRLSQRLGAVRGFARYLHSIDPATEIPPAGVFGKPERFVPHIYTDEQLTALLAATRRLEPALRAATIHALFGLLISTGMRIGEALRLTDDDVDLVGGVLTIRHAKFDRDRLVPLHPTVTDMLGDYARDRDRHHASARDGAFFVSGSGAALGYNHVHAGFRVLLGWTGIVTAAGNQPRVHDLRHAFTVNTLIGWQRDGIDIGGRLPVLSTYLGHVSPASTYWYLQAVPELMRHAADRLEVHAKIAPGVVS
ncbi:tyrosine-type recombinase/integrase [Agromyces bauzanensis]|uniref:tyrosine-type recombinase/integrase n=1 Tax=Agromyces bauzanensis TaxID=1308924 RepID=UPI00166DCFB1|nr:tyrosine-type recombinase/integrase [Agromyces bauzanensis]